MQIHGAFAIFCKRMIDKVPVNSFSFTGNEKKYLDECVETGWVSSEGPFIEKFESAFSKYVNRSYGIAVSSGSAALDIAVQAAGIGKGDEVIMPAFTIISPALSVIRAGAFPILVDSDPFTWNMDVSTIEAKITLKTKAIIVIHIYGLPVKMDKILELAKKYQLKIIEDAAEVHGQTYFNKKCGSFGDISIFSFYPNKIITTGEGGMILCNDPEIAKRCRKLRNLAFEDGKQRFIHYELGWNYRMTNMQAALGLAQLEQIDDHIAKKRSIGNFYHEQLSFLHQYGYHLPIPSTEYADNLYWVFALVAPNQAEKERTVKILTDHSIGTRPFFWCIHEQPVFKKLNLFPEEEYPVAEKLARNGFYIPSGLGLSKEEQKAVTKIFRSIYE